MHDRKQIVTIKGTRNGLTLFINDTCSYEEIIADLKEKISLNRLKKDEPSVSVTVQLGNRYVNEEQKEQLRELIGRENNLIINSFESDVVRKDEAIVWKENSDIKSINRIVRSGQVLNVTGDLLLVGDVNPGGKVVSTGNIYVMGNLRGIAHAGSNGDRQAIIAASYMNPSQLRIADYISRAPDYESSGVYMECGHIDKDLDKIVIDRLQVLSHVRNSLSGFERRIQNG
ncbi:MAG TPA: septum site-determining protein MinC [Virgibacillus sp.]|nr:septum site-determining protein MinC [Virgibacillus sp.]